jgi:hypothetical protein
MKTAVALLVLAAAMAYGFGPMHLSNAGANRFLDELESLSQAGKGEEYCARLHADLKVSIRDHSADPPADFDGNREDFCGYVTYAMRGFDILGLSTHATRHEFTATRSWLHPWTVEVSYHEDRLTTMSKTGATVHTASDDRLTLVQTLGGVKIIELESKVSLLP